MAYLLSQIFFSLVLAGLFGGAIGWIIHGYKSSQREAMLRDAMDRQSMAMNQVESDRQMIADDFDELKAHLETRIGELQYENRQIPPLNENLEKSQALVRQMMQKHDSEISELNNENRRLQSSLETTHQHERNLESELSTLRKINAEKILAGKPDLGTTSTSQSRNRISHVELTPPAQSHLSGFEKDYDSPAGISGSPDKLYSQDLADSNVLSQFSNDASQEINTGENNPETINVANVAEAKDTVSNLVIPSKSMQDVDSSESDDEFDTLTDFSGEFEFEDELQPLDGLVTETAPGNAKHKRTIDTLDDAFQADNEAPAFASSETIDNLQTIHGIGPVIERSLNDIGITSYQQIAHLSRKEIQEIADVLQIFPGRIERDNWVGSARKLVNQELEEA